MAQLETKSDAFVNGVIDVLLKHHSVLVALADDPQLTRCGAAACASDRVGQDDETNAVFPHARTCRTAEGTLLVNLTNVIRLIDMYQTHLARRRV